MTLSDYDRQALQSAIVNLERLVESLKARSGPPNPDAERDEARDRLRIVNPELTTLRQQLHDLTAAGVTVRAPSDGDRQVIGAALVALGARVGADQKWAAFCDSADKLLDSAQKIRANVGGRKA
jgi:hypothetical protein